MNKPLLSVITTSPAEQPSKTGTPAGGLGLAMRVGLDSAPPHITPDHARHMMGSLAPFNAQLAETEEELVVSREAAHALSKPAPRSWIASRVVTLLSHYFVAQQDAAVAEAVAEDWCAMLADYPAWAIANACRWWMGRENPRKHCKPLPGDIQDRAHIEMEPVRAARITIARGLAEPQIAQKPPVEAKDPDWWTEEAQAKRREFAASLGLKTFGETA